MIQNSTIVPIENLFFEFQSLKEMKYPMFIMLSLQIQTKWILLPVTKSAVFKHSKNSSAYRYGFSVGNLSGHFGPFALVNGFKWSFAQVHRIKIQNEVLSVSKCQ